MKTYKILFIILQSVLWVGCENRLEIDPTDNLSGELTLTSEDNIAAILIGVNNEMGQENTYGGELQLMDDLLGTTDEVEWGGIFLEPRQAITKSLLVDNLFVENIWENSYESINQANLVVDNIAIVTSSPEEANRIEGEARFLRALAYFDLIRNYAAPYQTGGGNPQPGVPLRLEGILDYLQPLEIARSSVEEIYTQIITDAQIAYSLLPEENGFYADKYAAQALLARVYLQKGNYSEARDATDDVLRNSGHSLASTYDGAFNNETDGPETIFAFQKTSQVTGGIDGNQLVNFYASQANGGRGGDVRIQDDYLALFDDPDTDFRASYFYISPDNDERLSSKYTIQFANVTIFRIAEMHLIRLESNFKEGTSIGLAPLAEINALRARSGTAPLASISDNIIFNERQLELAFEGFLIHDYRRTQRSVGDLAYDANALTFPIPQNEMDTNTLMEQNPGYGG
ncbi:RagB/SusD family nutrient uptake outer membrane protein [Pricia sp.]|uniref:RagB/SusD family nutrient uptake outer membrane protein n=1 Tax=Pricia sp. TaxID=2268138 RepID=UPI0035934B8D